MRRDFLVQALGIAAAYSLLLVVADVVSAGRMTARMEVGLVPAVLFNFGASCFIAMLLSKWHHLATTRWKAVALGTLVAMPAALALGLLFRPQYDLVTQLLGTIIISAGVGGIAAYVAWTD